jgi:hypothetical protein
MKKSKEDTLRIGEVMMVAPQVWIEDAMLGCNMIPGMKDREAAKPLDWMDFGTRYKGMETINWEVEVFE